MGKPTLQEDLVLSVTILAGIIEQASEKQIKLVGEVLTELSQAVDFKKEGNKSLKNQLRICCMLADSGEEETMEIVCFCGKPEGSSCTRRDCPNPAERNS